MRLFAALLLLTLSGLSARVQAHGDLHAQIQQLSARLRSEPNNAELWHKRGELQRADGDRLAALADYAHAEQLAPQLQVVHLSRGRTLLELNQLEAARHSLSLFLQHEPGHSEALLLRARASQRLGQAEEADSDLEQAILHSADPGPDLYLERAALLRTDGQSDRALQVLHDGLARLGSLVTLEQAALAIELDARRFVAALARVDRMLQPLARKEALLAQKADIQERAGRVHAAQETRRGALAQLEGLPLEKRTAHSRALEQKLRASLAVKSGRRAHSVGAP